MSDDTTFPETPAETPIESYLGSPSELKELWHGADVREALKPDSEDLLVRALVDKVLGDAHADVHVSIRHPLFSPTNEDVHIAVRHPLFSPTSEDEEGEKKAPAPRSKIALELGGHSRQLAETSDPNNAHELVVTMIELLMEVARLAADRSVAHIMGGIEEVHLRQKEAISTILAHRPPLAYSVGQRWNTLRTLPVTVVEFTATGAKMTMPIHRSNGTSLVELFYDNFGMLDPKRAPSCIGDLDGLDWTLVALLPADAPFDVVPNTPNVPTTPTPI